MIKQLNPPIPVHVLNRGNGIAHAIIDYGAEFDLLWVVFMNDTTECWTVSNKEIRAQFNQSLGRRQTEIKVSNY
jgi:hypothetical protein